MYGTNNRLKARIVEMFGTQSDFSVAISIREPRISRVIRRRELLTSNEKIVWAEKLQCNVKDIFIKA